MEHCCKFWKFMNMSTNSSISKSGVWLHDRTTCHMFWLHDRPKCRMFWLHDRQRSTCVSFLTDQHATFFGFLTDNVSHVVASWQTTCHMFWLHDRPTCHMFWLHDRPTCHMFWLHDRQCVTRFGFMTENMSLVLASWQTNDFGLRAPRHLTIAQSCISLFLWRDVAVAWSKIWIKSDPYVLTWSNLFFGKF